MRIVIVDDEERARNVLKIMLNGLGETNVEDFSRFAPALAHIRENGCDVAFLDIEMPDSSGLALAEELDRLADPPVVVFVTAYSQYAVQAWDVEAVDYVLKPFGPEHVRRALERAARRRRQAVRRTVHAHARCFPSFELWIDGAPLTFGYKKAKELLAYLVHMQGAWVSTDRIVYALFENSSEKNAKNYYRLVLHRLRQTLREVGLEEMMESGYGKARVNPAMFTCDYYQYLNGETSLFFGEYMADYGWAEQTLADLRQKHIR